MHESRGKRGVSGAFGGRQEEMREVGGTKGAFLSGDPSLRFDAEKFLVRYMDVLVLGYKENAFFSC